MTTGVLYILFEGYSYEKCKEELQVSIDSLCAHSDLPITVYSTKELDIRGDNICVQLVDPPVNWNSPVRGSIHNSNSRGGLAPKLDYLADLPYDVTIFADCDTKFYADPSILAPTTPWDFDMAICKESTCSKPLCGMVFNTGFMVIQTGERYRELIRIAQERLDEQPSHHDQWAINQALVPIHDFTLKLLPQKWNVRDPILHLIEKPCMVHSHRLI